MVDISTCAGGSGGVTTSDPDAADSATATDAPATISPCQAEEDACLADAECSSCAELSAEEEALVETCQGPDYDPDTVTCSARLEIVCCNVEGGRDCLATNDAMVALIGRY